MALTIGDTAPDFEAETTEGPISFHDWIGDSWAVLFSHPRAFTPVCTTELGYMASIKPEFDKRGVKIIGLSTDPVENSEKWSEEIGASQGTAPNYPLIADERPQGLEALRDAAGRRRGRRLGPHTRPQNQTTAQRLRDRARQEDQAGPGLSDDHRAQLRRGPAGDRLAAADRQQPGRHPGAVAAGRRTCSSPARSPTRDAKDRYPDGWESPLPYIRVVPSP